LQGPSPDKLRPLVSQAMPVLINAMQDPNVVVKDTATWTIGKICDLHATSIPADVRLARFFLLPFFDCLLSCISNPFLRL
ncbi:unnamed protein product, partial [Phaeothamnion confervicola]